MLSEETGKQKGPEPEDSIIALKEKLAALKKQESLLNEKSIKNDAKSKVLKLIHTYNELKVCLWFKIKSIQCKRTRAALFWGNWRNFKARPSVLSLRSSI